jgi:hypothetical protein
MAKIIRRTWPSAGPTGKRVRHVAYGYTLMVSGRQERKFSSAWLTEAEALEALAARQREIEAGELSRPQDRALSAVAADRQRRPHVTNPLGNTTKRSAT